MKSLRDILEESWAAQIPAKPRRFRSPNKQKLAEIIRSKKLRVAMKTLTIRLPDALITDIERESEARHLSKSDIVRQRLQRATSASGSMRELIGDLIGAVRNDALPSDLSSNKKKYLPALIRAKKRRRR